MYKEIETCVGLLQQRQQCKTFKTLKYQHFTFLKKRLGGMVVQWLALSPHSKKIPGPICGSTKGAFRCGAYMFSLCICGFLPTVQRRVNQVKWPLQIACECKWLFMSVLALLWTCILFMVNPALFLKSAGIGSGFPQPTIEND